MGPEGKDVALRPLFDGAYRAEHVARCRWRLHVVVGDRIAETELLVPGRPEYEQNVVLP